MTNRAKKLMQLFSSACGQQGPMCACVVTFHRFGPKQLHDGVGAAGSRLICNMTLFLTPSKSHQNNFAAGFGHIVQELLHLPPVES